MHGNFEEVKKEDWSMDRRWAFSQSVIYYDPKDLIEELIRKKLASKKVKESG